MVDQFGTAAPLNLNVTATPQVAVEPAGFWRRFAATFIDGMIASIGSYVLYFAVVLLGVALKPVLGEVVVGIVTILGSLVSFIVVPLGYFGYFYSKKGASPGKMVMDLRVLRDDTGTHLSFWRAVGRESFGKFLSMITLYVGFFLAAFREDKKALHDLAFGTRVVRIRK